MRSLIHQRCFNHSLREAAARCPECKQFYCRECITEHDERVICASCLKKLAKVPLRRRSGWVGVLRGFQVLFGLAITVIFFYLVGQSLLSMPDAFHDGTIWKPSWSAEE